MRHLGRIFFSTLLLACASARIQAQLQTPTAEELEMTSDPKAPGAAAVYLFIEEKTDDTYHFHSYYARIKVLTEKGKELATVSVPYEKGQFEVKAIEGRTIHSDGTIVPLKAKPADLMAYRGGGHQYNQMTFNLPSVEVGSILEYRLQIRYSESVISSPAWLVQQPYFVHKAHYLFVPIFNDGEGAEDKHGHSADRLMWATRIRSGELVSRDMLRRYTFDINDVPPLPSGDFLPPLNTIRESVLFFYTNANSGPEFWNREAMYWAKDAERFTAASSAIKKAALDLVAPGDNDESKARKIYAAVMKIDSRDFAPLSHDGEMPKASKDAGGVWKQQRGTRDEIALLFVALARAAGLKAWPMQVVNRDRAVFEPTYLSTDQLDDYIAVLQIDGKDIYLDPGEKMCAFGILHWKHELAKGFRLSGNGAAIEETPAGPPKAAGIRRKADVSVDDHGGITGTGSIVLNGQEALYWRQRALLEDQSELKKSFIEYVESSLPDGVNAELEGLDGQTEYESDLTARLKLSGVLGSSSGKHLTLPGALFEAREKHLFVEQEAREVPVDLHYATMEQDEVTYHLPSGLDLLSLPTDPNLEWTERIKMSITAAPADGAVSVKRTFVRTSALLDPSLYSTLRYIYQRIATADQQPIVLGRTPEVAVD
jgi:hypothetical protein